jgi:hypothetical protein
MGRQRHKSGHGKRRFVMLPHDLLDMPEYMDLSHKSKNLLVELLKQYNGKNNGDLCITLSVMKKRGWNSNDTIRTAMKELTDAGFVILTRQGGRNQCSLYGLTWLPIDECQNKLEIPSCRTPINPLPKKVR